AVLNDVRRIDAGRHDLEHGLTGGSHLGDGGLDLGPRLEVDADHADAEQRLTLDMLDVVDSGGEHALVDEHDARFNLVGGHAGVVPDHGDDRNVELGEDVGGGAVDADAADHGDEQRHHDERVSASQRQLNDPHDLRSPQEGRRQSHPAAGTPLYLARRIPE